MPDYLNPFLQQLSEGTRVLGALREEALRREQMGFEREQTLRQNVRQDRMDANADIGALARIREMAQPVEEGGVVTRRMSAPTSAFGASGDVPVAVTRRVDPSRVVSYATSDGKTRNFELLSPEEMVQRRMEELRAATLVKMLPEQFRQTALDKRAQADRTSREGIAQTNATSRKAVADANAASRMEVAKVGAASREGVARVGAESRERVAKAGAESRERAAKIGADARLGAAAMGAKAGLTQAQMGVQGRFDEGQMNRFARELQAAQQEEQELHAKKLEAGQAKYKSDKWGDPAKARDAVLAGLDGRIKAARDKQAAAQAEMDRMSKQRVTLRNPAAEQRAAGATPTARTVARAQVEAFAKQRGVSVEQAIAQARREGYEVK